MSGHDDTGDHQSSTTSPNPHGSLPRKNSFKKASNGDDFNHVKYGQHVDHYDEHDLEHHNQHTNHEMRPLTAQDMEFYKSGQATISLKEKSSAPGPLGLLGFGLTTFLLNMHNAGVYPMNAMIIAMGVCYGGAAQIIAGLLEWKRGNLFASIAFLSYGFFWWSLCMILVLPKLGWAAAADHTSMGCYLFIWGCFSFCMLVGTFVKRLPIMLSWVFFTVVLLFALLAARHWMDSEEMEKIAGVEGVICGLSAIYVAFGEILNELSGRTILWIGVRPPLK